MYSNDHATLQHTHNTQTRRGNTNLLYTVQLQHSENSDTLKKIKNLKQNDCYSASVLMIKRISAKICILCVRVKINKRSFELFVFGSGTFSLCWVI